MLLSNLENTFHTVAQAPGGVARLRELILTLAVQGKLVAQDASDEPASELLKKIRGEKNRLIAEGKIKKDKPLAEVTEEEKLFELPVGWEWTRLGKVVNSSEAGWSPSCIGTPRQNGGWGVLKVSAVSWGYFDALANKELPQGLEPKPEYEVKDGDFLLSRANTAELVARSVVVDKAESKLMLSDKIIRLQLSSYINRFFINLVNNSQYARTHYAKNVSGTSSSMKNVSREVVLALPVPLPPLAEQSHIVARVEEFMRLCDALEEKGRLEHSQHQQLLQAMLGSLTQTTDAAELARHWQRLAQHFDLLIDRPEAVDALEQTILQLAVRGLLVPQDPSDEPASELLKKIRTEKDRLIAEGKIKKDKPLPEVGDDENSFELPMGWQTERLGNLLNISSGITLGRKTAINNPIEVPYLRVANVQRWRLELTSMKSIIIDETEVDKYKLLQGDLLITEGGDWDKVGRTAIWNDDLPFCAHQNHVFKARKASAEWNVIWSELYLNSDIARTYFASSAKQTTNLASINMTQLKNCVFPVPPLAEQSRIVARVTELRALCQQLRAKLSQARTTQTQLAQAWVEQAAA